jgi:hypothetical protein
MKVLSQKRFLNRYYHPNYYIIGGATTKNSNPCRVCFTFTQTQEGE